MITVIIVGALLLVLGGGWLTAWWLIEREPRGQHPAPHFRPDPAPLALPAGRAVLAIAPVAGKPQWDEPDPFAYLGAQWGDVTGSFKRYCERGTA